MAAAAANRQLGPDAWTSELASLLISTVPYLSLETHKTAVPTISNNDDDRRKKKNLFVVKNKKKEMWGADEVVDVHVRRWRTPDADMILFSYLSFSPFSRPLFSFVLE